LKVESLEPLVTSAEVYEWNLATMRWYTLETKGTYAPGCYGLSGVVYNNYIVLFGGGDGRHWYNSVYIYKYDLLLFLTIDWETTRDRQAQD
jgi:hypothetical protein